MARAIIQGFAEQGGYTITTDGRVSTTVVQRSFPLCTVTVFDAGTATPSTIFSDVGGTPKANPFIADDDGYWFFWADDGSYDVQFSGAGISSPFTLFNFVVGQSGALNDPGANGMLARTSPNTVTPRTITGITNEIVVTDGNGVGGNPTIGLATFIDFTGKTLNGGTYLSPGIANFGSAQHDHDDAAGGGQLNATNVFSTGTVPVPRLPVMVGATGISNGTAGLVPQPLIADVGNFLRGDGTWATAGGGGGSPGGSNTQIQYNNSGAFGGVSGATSDGTNIIYGIGNLRATSPRITTNILDTNGNAIITLSAVGSSVNNLQIANAAAGGVPTIAAIGTDGNININLTPKGTGVVFSAGNITISNNTPTVTFVDVNDSKQGRIVLSGSNWSFINDTLGTTPINIDTTNNLVTLVGQLQITRSTADQIRLTNTTPNKNWIMVINNSPGSLVIGEDGVSNAITIAPTTGVTTFSAIPVGPASDPTTANQLTRKQYVDDKLITFSIPFRIDDPSTPATADESIVAAVRVPAITGAFLNKITIIRVGGSHTGGTSVTFRARILNSSDIGSGISFNDTNNLNLTPYTEDFTDVAISEGNFITITISARSGTVTERNVSINIEGYRKPQT